MTARPAASARKCTCDGSGAWRTMRIPRCLTYQAAMAGGSATLQATCSRFKVGISVFSLMKWNSHARLSGEFLDGAHWRRRGETSQTMDPVCVRGGVCVDERGTDSRAGTGGAFARRAPGGGAIAHRVAQD